MNKIRPRDPVRQLLGTGLIGMGLALSCPAPVSAQLVGTGPAMQQAQVNLDTGLQSGDAAGPNAENPPVATTGPNAPGTPPPATDGGVAGYFENWFHRVNEAQASQPHWMSPLVTVTPRLEEELRYDQYWEHRPNGASLDNYGNGKGVELIPTTTNEVIFGLPPYEEQTRHGVHTDGFGDYPVFTVKQRLLSEDEQNGNAIITAFLGVAAPTGSSKYTGNAYVVTPTIAGGKGFGNFDVQATMGVALPVGAFDTTGAQLLTNVTLQYHLLTYFWPELEFNDTIWLGGSERGGKDQLFLTPGLVLGRFVIGGRMRASIGAGYQFAVSPSQRLTGELDPVYDHNWILSVRLNF